MLDTWKLPHRVHARLIFTSFTFHHYVLLDTSYLGLPWIGKLMEGKGKTSGALQNLGIIYVATSSGIKVPTGGGMKDG